MAKQKDRPKNLREYMLGKGTLDIEENIRNAFTVSFGNLEVLARIPYMMADPKWRDQLRKLVLEFICEETLKRNKGSERLKGLRERLRA